MKLIKSWPFWVAMAAVLIPIFFFIYRLHDSQFLDGTMGNWFATTVGVIIGIPIALEINRHQQKEQERREQLLQEEEKLKRKNKILTLINNELIYNKKILIT